MYYKTYNTCKCNAKRIQLQKQMLNCNAIIPRVVISMLAMLLLRRFGMTRLVSNMIAVVVSASPCIAIDSWCGSYHEISPTFPGARSKQLSNILLVDHHLLSSLLSNDPLLSLHFVTVFLISTDPSDAKRSDSLLLSAPCNLCYNYTSLLSCWMISIVIASSSRTIQHSIVYICNRYMRCTYKQMVNGISMNINSIHNEMKKSSSLLLFRSMVAFGPVLFVGL